MIPGGPKPVAPFSHAVETDGFVFVTGQMPDTPSTPGILPDGIVAQTKAVMENLKVVLAGVGLGLEHVVMAHPKMTQAEWEGIYRQAWKLYYSPEHIETLLRRAIVTNLPLLSFMKVLVQFTTMMQVEKVHPLQSGLFRLKHVDERRPGLPTESRLTFYPRFVWTLIANNLKLIATIWWMLKLKRRIERDPNCARYMDQALTPVRDDDEDTLDLLTKTAGAKAAIAHLKRVDELTHAAAG